MVAMVKLLITGQMRSGTTLIANVLNAQKGIVVYRDFLHIDRLKKALYNPHLTEPLNDSQKRYLIHVFNSGNRDLGFEWEVNPSTFDCLLTFYDEMLNRLHTGDMKVVGHKTTNSEPIVAELIQHKYDLKVIYMIRDPRDVVISAIHRFADMNSFEAVKNWRDGYEKIRPLLNIEPFRTRILKVRYEDLLLDTDSILERLSSFLGVECIDLPDRMLDYGRDWQDNSAFNDLSGGLNPKPIGRWKNYNKFYASLTCAILRKYMTENHYEIQRDHSPHADSILRAWFVWHHFTRLFPRCIPFVWYHFRGLFPKQASNVSRLANEYLPRCVLRKLGIILTKR